MERHVAVVVVVVRYVDSVWVGEEETKWGTKNNIYSRFTEVYIQDTTGTRVLGKKVEVWYKTMNREIYIYKNNNNNTRRKKKV